MQLYKRESSEVVIESDPTREILAQSTNMQTASPMGASNYDSEL